MRYLLNVYTINELGMRPEQEDTIYPPLGKQSDADRLFLVCDGMGGHEEGGMASRLVCEAISRSIMLSMADQEGYFSDEQLYQAINDAYDVLDSQPQATSQLAMGTTMALLKLHEGGATIAHIGDSRVYHIRPGEDAQRTRILFRTTDHSGSTAHSVNRAMQPAMPQRSVPDIYHTTDILPGDYFYLCSDGMLEQMDDTRLCFNFSDVTGNDENKIDILRRATNENRDNHSAVIVHILDVDAGPVITRKHSTIVTPAPNRPSSIIGMVASAVAVLAGIGLAIWLLWPSKPIQPEAQTSQPALNQSAPASSSTSSTTHYTSTTTSPSKPSKPNKPSKPQKPNKPNTPPKTNGQTGAAAVVGAASGQQSGNNGTAIQQAVQSSSQSESVQGASSDQDQIGDYMKRRRNKK